MPHITEIKRLFQEAGEAHDQATAKMKDYEGKAMPAEVSAEVDKLLDVCESKQAAARQYEKLDAQEKALADANRVDETKRLAVNSNGTVEEKKAAEQDERRMDIFRKGLVSGFQSLTFEEKAGLMGSDDTAGGYLIGPQQFVAELVKAMDNETFIRRLARNIQLDQAVSLGVPALATNPNDFDWTGEVKTVNQDNALTFGKRELKPSPLSKVVLISEMLMRYAALKPDDIVKERAGYILGVTQEKAFLTGTGSDQPLGVFTPSTAGISTSRDTPAASATVLAGDDFINVRGALKPQYLRNAQWVMHRNVVTAARKIKASGTGEYMWQPGLQAGTPDMLLGIPINQSEFAPSSIATAQYVAILGDFKAGYWIAEALKIQIKVLDQLYALNNQIAYRFNAMIDGMPVLEEAFARLQMA